MQQCRQQQEPTEASPAFAPNHSRNPRRLRRGGCQNDKTFNITTVYPVVLRDDTGILTKWECFKILYIASKWDKENREEILKRNRKKLAEEIARVL